jgi:hypothetical protein
MRDGFRQAVRSPFLLVGLWLLCALVALPAAFWIGESIDRSLDSSLSQEEMRNGFDFGWYGEYSAGASRLEKSFTPAVNRGGAFFDNLDGWLSGDLFARAAELLALGLLFAVLWTLMLGGVLARFVRPEERAGPGVLFRNGTRYFFRFLRLIVVAGVLYALVYAVQHHWMTQLEARTRDATSELTVFGYHLAIWIPVAVLLMLIHTVFDYAKIATVVEDRRSVLLAALRGFGFVVGHPLRTLGLVLAWVAVGALGLAIYAFVAPGAAVSTPTTVTLGFVIGQLFLMARLLVRLSLLAGEVQLYRALSVPIR